MNLTLIFTLISFFVIATTRSFANPDHPRRLGNGINGHHERARRFKEMERRDVDADLIEGQIEYNPAVKRTTAPGTIS
jgi:hypothetical protein